MRQRCRRIVAYSLCLVILILFGGTSTTWASTTYLLSPNVSYVPFGNVAIGKTTSYRVLLTNTGNSTVRISGLNTVGVEFKATSLPLPYNLAPGQNFSVNIAFNPTKAGAVSGSVAVASNATNSSKTGISGTGVQASLAVIPGTVNFASVPVGVANTQTVTLVNKGQSYIHVTKVSANGTGFSVHGLYLPLNIAPGHSSAFTLRFAPTKIGTATGTLTTVSNATDATLTVPLAGSGVSSSSKLALSKSSLNFGNVTIGLPSTSPITLTNQGNTAVTVQGIKVSGAEFSGTGYAVPFSVAVGQSASFTVHFAPTVAGSVAGNVSVTSTAATTASNISLSGTGVLPATHFVVLTWVPSNSAVVGYHVYRAANTAGPFQRLSSSLVYGTTYTDATVQTDTNYFYVATAVDSVGIESLFSNEISVAVP